MTIKELMKEKLFKKELVRDEQYKKLYLFTLVIPAKTKLYGKNSFTPLFLDDLRDMNNVFLRMMKLKGSVLKENKFNHKLLVSDNLKVSASIFDIGYRVHYSTEFEGVNEGNKDERIYLIGRKMYDFELVHLEDYDIKMKRVK